MVFESFFELFDGTRYSTNQCVEKDQIYWMKYVNGFTKISKPGLSLVLAMDKPASYDRQCEFINYANRLSLSSSFLSTEILLLSFSDTSKYIEFLQKWSIIVQRKKRNFEIFLISELLNSIQNKGEIGHFNFVESLHSKKKKVFYQTPKKGSEDF